MSPSTKPPALASGGALRIVSPASGAEKSSIRRGIAELKRLGYRVEAGAISQKPDRYFAAPLARRVAELKSALSDPDADALMCVRGGYGSAALLDRLRLSRAVRPKLLIGFSDITVLHAFLWQRLGWPSVHGPMVAAGFDRGANEPCGYDPDSFVNAVSGAQKSWALGLRGETLVAGEASGTLLGGCLTLLQTSLGTPWELDTRGAILLLEDRAVKPYQLDRVLLHLTQAGKLRGVRGIILGEFPESGEARGGFGIRDVCRRMLGSLGVPIIFGAPIGHASRPMLTVPLGVRVRLHARGEGKLDILESPVATQTRT